MAKKKLKLECASHEEITLLGICTTLPDYRMIHYINKGMNVTFVRQQDLPYYKTEEQALLFPLYHFLNETSGNNWFVLSNTSSAHKKMIPAMKNIDFFVLIDDLLPADKVDDLLSKMRSVNGIQLASKIDISGIKNMEHIYADMEMHLMEVQREPRGIRPMWKRTEE